MSPGILKKRLAVQQRSVNVCSLMKSVKRQKVNRCSLTFEEIMKIVNDRNDFREKGGYYEVKNGVLTLYHAGGPVTKYNQNKKVHRHGFKFDDTLAMDRNAKLWHSHPRSQGWWPSLEDLHTTRNASHVIFTVYGIWVLKKMKPDTPLDIRKVNTVFEFLDYDLSNRTKKLLAASTANEFNGPFKCIVDTIQSLFIPKFKECGIRVHFFPGTETLKRDITGHLSKY